TSRPPRPGPAVQSPPGVDLDLDADVKALRARARFRSHAPPFRTRVSSAMGDRCRACNDALPTRARFCPNCGQPVAVTVPMTAAAATPAAAAAFAGETVTDLR